MKSREFRFNKKAIEMLEPAPSGSRIEYRDTDKRGLCLRINQKGRIVFSVHKRVKNGRTERITIGEYPSITIEKARNKALEIVSMLSNGVSVAEGLKMKRSQMTFADLFELFYSQHSIPNKITHISDQQKYTKYLKAPLGNKKLAKIDRGDIGSIHSFITASGHGVTANRTIALISAVFSWAIDRGYYTLNPASGIRKNKEKSRERYIPPNEMAAFLRATQLEENEIIRDYILVSLFTGARRSNVLSMCWSDIDLSNRVWNIKRTKNGMSQTIPLTPEAIGILSPRSRNQSSNYVFPSTGKYGHLMEPKKGWVRIIMRANCLNGMSYLKSRDHLSLQEEAVLNGMLKDSPSAAYTKLCNVSERVKIDINIWRMEDLWMHDLRRTYGSWQAMNGVSPLIIGKSLNHQSPASTKIYARMDMDPVREATSAATSAMRKKEPPIGTNQIYH
jgi:integrase